MAKVSSDEVDHEPELRLTIDVNVREARHLRDWLIEKCGDDCRGPIVEGTIDALAVFLAAHGGRS